MAVGKWWFVVSSAIVVLAGQPAATRPAVLGLAHVRVWSRDLAAARRFYGGLLGFGEMASPSAGVAVFHVNDRQRIIVAGGLPPGRDDRFVDLAWETADVAAMRRYLASKGVEARDADEPGEGPAAETLDADQHRIEFVQLAAPGAAADARNRRISRRILHAGLTIRDPAAADRFYKDVLGFGELWRGGRPEGTINWINMRAPEGTDYLEYMLLTSQPDRRQLGTMHHIALLVTDIQAALETVRARTAGDDPNHRAVPQVGVNRRWQLNVYDPDGTRIEFMEPWTMR